MGCGRVIALFVASVLAAAPRFALTDTDGHTHTAAEWNGKRFVVLFFVTTDCPLCNTYVPEMNRIEEGYAPRGVAFYAVQGDATIPVADVHRHAREYGYRFAYLLDPEESLAQYTGATANPEAAVLTPAGKLLYLGRIDNRLEDFGNQRVKVTEFDLRDTLDALLAGEPAPKSRTKALGCAITRRR